MGAIASMGLGNMGGPLAANLIKAGHQLKVFDLAPAAAARLAEAGAAIVSSPGETSRDSEIVITMLPAGQQVRDIYLGTEGLIGSCPPGSLLIDCSTIDVATAREVSAAAEEAGLDMLDAPVSGGVAGAQAGTLTFIAGGEQKTLPFAPPLLLWRGQK